jgi:hypothetical protein
MLPLNTDRESFENKLKNKVAPIFYDGIILTLEQIYEREDEVAFVYLIELIKDITRFDKSPHECIKTFVKKVKVRPNGDEFSWFMEHKMSIILNN